MNIGSLALLKENTYRVFCPIERNTQSASCPLEKKTSVHNIFVPRRQAQRTYTCTALSVQLSANTCMQIPYKLTLTQASQIKFPLTTKLALSTNSKFYFVSRTEV
jgi:hypothetical protein